MSGDWSPAISVQ